MRRGDDVQCLPRLCAVAQIEVLLLVAEGIRRVGNKEFGAAAGRGKAREHEGTRESTDGA